MSDTFQLILIDPKYLKLDANSANLAKLNFQAKYKQTAFLVEQNLLYVGTELAEIRTTDTFYKLDYYELGAAAGIAIGKLKLEHLIIAQPRLSQTLSNSNLLGLQLGISQALWKFEKYLKPNNDKQLIIQLSSDLQANFGQVYQNKLEALNSGIITAREIIEETPENFNPATAPEIVRSELQGLPNIEITVWDKKTLIEKGLNAIVAVGRASVNQPNLTYVVLNRQNVEESQRTDKVMEFGIVGDEELVFVNQIMTVVFDPSCNRYALWQKLDGSYDLLTQEHFNPATFGTLAASSVIEQTGFLDLGQTYHLGSRIINWENQVKTTSTAFLIKLNSLARKPVVETPDTNLIWLTAAEVGEVLSSGIDQVIVEVLKRGVSRAIALKFDSLADSKVFDKKFINRVALVGKGLTYDTGGLDIKVGGNMKTMKCDMGGGATMLGTVKALAEIGNLGNTEVHWITAWVENSTGSDSYRSDDIVTTLSGQTVEIFNTDAEGRLTLADALTLATTLEPTAIVEASTLTGMSIQANSDYYTALFGNDESLSSSILKSFIKNGERVIDNGMSQILVENVRGEISDLINTSKGNRKAGHITAALFLDHFVNQHRFRNDKLEIKHPFHYPYVHLDIAGTAFNASQNPLKHNGSTGHNIRSLVDWVLALV